MPPTSSAQLLGKIWIGVELLIGGGRKTYQDEQFVLVDFVDEGDPSDNYYIGQRWNGTKLTIPQSIIDNYGRIKAPRRYRIKDDEIPVQCYETFDQAMGGAESFLRLSEEKIVLIAYPEDGGPQVDRDGTILFGLPHPVWVTGTAISWFRIHKDFLEEIT